MKRWLVPWLMLPLCGCLAEQKHEADKCELSTRQSYPAGDFFFDEGMQRLFTLCMKVAGYELWERHPKCQLTWWTHPNAYCWRPQSLTGRLINEIEMLSDPDRLSN
jgi:hypothetical protein